MLTYDGVPIQVLLVERNAEVSESLVFLLTQLGCQVTAVTTGAAAIASGRSSSFHAVYSSLMLSDMHGCQLARALRDLPGMHESVLVALSGYFEPGIEAECRRSGFDYYFLKPVSFADLLAPLHAVPGCAGGRAIEESKARLGSPASAGPRPED